MEKYCKYLRFFSWIYVAFVVLGILGIVVVCAFPGQTDSVIKQTIGNVNLHGINPTTIFAITYGFIAAWYLIYAVLLRRVANNKSSGTFIMIILIIAIIANLISTIRQFNVSRVVGLGLDAYVLYLIHETRKDRE